MNNANNSTESGKITDFEMWSKVAQTLDKPEIRFNRLSDCFRDQSCDLSVNVAIYTCFDAGLELYFNRTSKSLQSTLVLIYYMNKMNKPMRDDVHLSLASALTCNNLADTLTLEHNKLRETLSWSRSPEDSACAFYDFARHTSDIVLAYHKQTHSARINPNRYGVSYLFKNYLTRLRTIAKLD